MKNSSPVSGVSFSFQEQRAEKGEGTGDFSIAKAVVDFAREMAMQVLQLLPFGWSGAYNSPYSEASSRAIDPRFVSVANAIEAAGSIPGIDLKDGQVSLSELRLTGRDGTTVEMACL